MKLHKDFILRRNIQS